MAKSKFSEGQICEFMYVKDILLDEEFMVFEDSDKEKYLLPAHYYKSYNLNPNATAKCTITRIDCSGKISFEPEHPYYKIGEIYEFDFVKMLLSEETEYSPITGKSTILKDYWIIVADRYGNEHHVAPLKWQQKRNFRQDKIKCRLEKIIKGHFHLKNLEKSRPFIRKILSNIKPD